MGKGHYGKVFQGYLRSNPELKLAIKSFKKDELSPTVLKFI